MGSKISDPMEVDDGYGENARPSPSALLSPTAPLSSTALQTPSHPLSQSPPPTPSGAGTTALPASTGKNTYQ